MAYSSLLQEQRRLLHARIVEALDDPRRLGQVCRFLSDYFYLGGAYDQAIAASQRALAEHALARAGAHQQRGRQAYDLRLLGEIGAQREPPEVEQAESYLPPGPRPGRRARHAPTPGPLPPRPRHPVRRTTGQREQAHVALSAAIGLTAPWT